MSAGRGGRGGPGAPRLPQGVGNGRGCARFPSSPGLPCSPPAVTSPPPCPGRERRRCPARCPAAAVPGPGSLGSLVAPAELPGRDGAAALQPAIPAACPVLGMGCARFGRSRDSLQGYFFWGRSKLASESLLQPLTVWVLNRINLWACCSFALSVHRTSLSCLHTTCYQP